MRRLLNFTVFSTGFVVLAIEVAAVRMLSPYYGNTMYTFSSVLSVILGALSVGYYFGGKLSDKKPDLKVFYNLILISGIWVLLLQAMRVTVLPIVESFSSFLLGPLIASFVLFFFPSVLLGMLSPFAIKLQEKYNSKQGIGQISGEVFFWSTLGSILGSLTTGFVLIPNLGITQIIYLSGSALILLSVLSQLYTKVRKLDQFQSTIIILAVSFFFNAQLTNFFSERALYLKDGVYEQLKIVDYKIDGENIRFFYQDKSSSGAVDLDTKELFFEYTKYYKLYKLFKPEAKQALVLGGGIYSIPNALLKEPGEIEVDVVEIEPKLYELGKEYFFLEDSVRLKNFITDGRYYLSHSEKEYDLIFADAYNSYVSIPAHFTTKEFFDLSRNKLSDDGVFIANFIGNIEEDSPSLLLSAMKTFKQSYPHSYFFAMDSPNSNKMQNFIFLGVNNDNPRDVQFVKTTEVGLPLANTLVADERLDLSKQFTFTDEYAPVESLVRKLLEIKANERNQPQGEILKEIDSQLAMGERYIGSPGHKKIQTYLENYAKKYSSEVVVQSWEHKTINNENYSLKNILARFNPEASNRLIIGTHYDTKIGIPGANDGASGTAILLSLLGKIPKDLNIGLDIVFFDGEEGDPKSDDISKWYPIGSTYFAQNINSLYSQKPSGAIVIDMVCDTNLEIFKEQSSSVYAGQLQEQFWNLASSEYPNIFKNTIKYNIIDDHTPLNSIGIPSILLIDFDYPYFHTRKDSLDKCSENSLMAVEDVLLQFITREHFQTQ